LRESVLKLSLNQESASPVAGEVGPHGSCRFAKTCDNSHHGRVKHAAQRERDNRAHSRKDECASRKDVDNEAPEIAPMGYPVHEGLMLDNQDTENDRCTN